MRDDLQLVTLLTFAAIFIMWAIAEFAGLQ